MKIPTDPIPQFIPWGVSHIVGLRLDGADIIDWIIDSGVDTNISDFNIDSTRGPNFVHPVKEPGDIKEKNGYGRHVVGTNSGNR